MSPPTIPLNSAHQSPPKSLCILRLSAIGDVTHIVPIIRTLQHQWPSTKLTWIIGKTEAALVYDIEGVEFIIFNKREGRHAYGKLRKTLSDRHFDVLLHMQSALRASIASLMIRADTKIGFDKSRARDFQHWFTNKTISGPTRVHVIDTFFQFIETLGINERIMKWDIPVSTDDIAFAKKVIDGKPTLVINPCTSDRSNNWRNWEIKRYAEVIDYAAETYGLHTVLTGGSTKKELELGEAIATQSSTLVTNMIGQSTLKQLQALLSMAKVVIAPDTGPAHIAAATGVPVIGLYASSNPQRTGPYNSLKWTIDKYPVALQQFNQLAIADTPWGKRVRAAEVMDIIKVKDVTAMLDKIMQKK